MVYVETQIADDNPYSEQGITHWLDTLAKNFDETARIRIEKALKFAEHAHRGQTRASGEPYIGHALAVAEIANTLNLDENAIIAALLHDTTQTGRITVEEIEQVFNPDVAKLVDGVTKMGHFETLSSGENALRAESLRKLLLAMAEDVRVVLIKLSDRLHNMRTLRHLSEEQQIQVAKETADIFAPLANRLGIWQIKWELEDLSFRYLNPVRYHQIAKALDERRVDREKYIEKAIKRIKQELAKVNIEADVNGRPKHIYSIWKKMSRKGVGLDQIYDVRAVRILADNLKDCYHALGIVHSIWKHIPKEFDDYIATPKENNYQSIHTAVIGPGGKTLEIQIRTKDMHKHAELGVAAHWRYKEGGKSDNDFERKIAWLRQLLEWKEEARDDGDFIDRFKSEVFQDRVYVITPKGEVIDLPQGATPLDFAYSVHTEVGHRCRGAKVDGRIVPLTYELKSGQQVHVLTAKKAEPSRDWLSPHLGYLKTPRARTKVRHWFNSQTFEQLITQGKHIFDEELKRLGHSSLDPLEIAQRFKYDRPEDLYAALGRGDISSTQLAKMTGKLNATPETEEDIQQRVVRRQAPAPVGKEQFDIMGVGNLMTRLANCCHPAPGDKIVGFITHGRGITVHRQDCPTILRLQDSKEHRLIEIDWQKRVDQVYAVEIEIHAIDRTGLLRDISNILANEKVNVTDVNTHSKKGASEAFMNLRIEIEDTQQLSKVLGKINQLPNILSVHRKTH